MTSGADVRPNADGRLPDGARIVVAVDPEIADLIPSFLGNREEDVSALRDAVGRGDVDLVREIGHRLKGMGGGYGFPYITRAGAAIEDAAKAGRLDEVNGWLDGLAAYLERIEIVEGEE